MTPAVYLTFPERHRDAQKGRIVRPFYALLRVISSFHPGCGNHHK